MGTAASAVASISNCLIVSSFIIGCRVSSAVEREFNTFARIYEFAMDTMKRPRIAVIAKARAGIRAFAVAVSGDTVALGQSTPAPALALPDKPSIAWRQVKDKVAADYIDRS
jgi:hypothetical protein